MPAVSVFIIYDVRELKFLHWLYNHTVTVLVVRFMTDTVLFSPFTT